MQLRLRHSLSWIGLLLAAACTDMPTFPVAEPAAGPLDIVGTAPQGQAHGLAQSTCTFAIRDETGMFRSRYTRVAFPVSELHPGGIRQDYIYRGHSEGRLVFVARCIIPATARAVHRMDRLFRVERRSTGAGDVTTMGCVTTDEGCTLDPVVVEGCMGGGTPPDCDSGGNDYDYDSCYYHGECGGSGGWEWSGGDGGSGAGPGDPNSPDDGTGRPPCKRDANGFCITRDVSEEEWQKLIQRVEEIREDSEECRGAKNALRGFLAQGRLAKRIRFWDGYDKYWDATEGAYQQRIGQNLSDSEGRFIEYDSYWVWHDRPLIVHEGLHLWLFQTNSSITDQENWVAATAPTCV